MLQYIGRGSMENRFLLTLSFVTKAAPAAGMAAVALPLILGITNAPLLRAQTDPNLRFEVAAVRRVDIPLTENGGVPIFPPTGGVGTSDPHRKAYRGAQLVALIAEAFGVRGERIVAPKGALGERYDIVANIPDGATEEQYNVMLGNLLRDRLHLRFHMESQTLPVYALHVAKNGPKFKQTVALPRAAGDAARATGPDAEGFPTLTPNFHGMVGRPRPGEIFWAAQDVPITDLANTLSGNPVIGRPVIDETGLAGRYDFKIHFHWAGGNADDDPAPSVFTAVEEQLGLKLDPANRPVEKLVIDSIDREPTDN